MSHDLHKKLVQFIEDRYFAEFNEKIKVEGDTNVFTSGYIDSLGFVALMMVLEEHANINIDEFMLMDREDLSTVNNIIKSVHNSKIDSAEDNHSVVFLVSGAIPETGQSYKGFSILYHSQKIIKEKFDECSGIIQRELGVNISEIVLDNLAEDNNIIQSLILFSIEYSLLHFWQSIGVEPEALMGEGTGEYVAACFSGVINLTDAVIFLAASVAESSDMKDENLKSVAINQKQQHKQSKIKLSSPRVPFISTGSGDWIEDEVQNLSYWDEVINNSAFFSSGLMKLLDDQKRIFIEIGLGGDITKKFKMNGASSGRDIISTFVDTPDKDEMHESLKQAVSFLNSKDIKTDLNLNL